MFVKYVVSLRFVTYRYYKYEKVNDTWVNTVEYSVKVLNITFFIEYIAHDYSIFMEINNKSYVCFKITFSY